MRDLGSLGVLRVAVPSIAFSAVSVLAIAIATAFAWLAVEFVTVGASALSATAQIAAFGNVLLCVALSYVVILGAMEVLGLRSESTDLGSEINLGPRLLGGV